MAEQLPIKEGLFTWPADKPQLLGSRCRNCGEYAFPAQPDCRSCSGQDTEIVELGDRGTLWTWTIQGFPPKNPPYAGKEKPEDFVPYGVGYVELPGHCKVETRLTTANPKELKIGMPMEMQIVKFMEDDDGNDVMMFVFAPAEAA